MSKSAVALNYQCFSLATGGRINQLHYAYLSGDMSTSDNLASDDLSYFDILIRVTIFQLGSPF